MRCSSSGNLYLGAPIWFDRKNNSAFHHLSANIRLKILGWESNLLLQEGRTCLIKSVSNNRTNFVLGCTPCHSPSRSHFC